jgi:hypothetical protein
MSKKTFIKLKSGNQRCEKTAICKLPITYLHVIYCSFFALPSLLLRSSFAPKQG